MRTGSALGMLCAAACGVLLSSCKAPKYAAYTSIHKDFRCSAPWGWSVLTDGEGSHYADTTFIGPFEPAFYLGAPSLRVRWYSYSYPHRLPDGTLEMYASADDYVRHLATVYRRRRIMRQAPRDIELPAAGRKAENFVVLSPAPVAKGARWGTEIETRTQQPVNLRQHAYVILPMKTGFYAIIYPATREGFGDYEPQFNELVNTFEPLKDGPGGPEFAKGAKAAAALPFQ